MNFKHLILPGSALALCAALLAPARDADAWTLLGGSLGQDQRDFRVYNNFSDSTANDNSTPDPQFPGSTGAVLAIWKAGVEWGSSLHGDGSGDPHQPNGLGSGGANFDLSFQGEASGVGGINDNIHSELSGSDMGTLAFTEAPISNGWRIRYYSTWVWDDGPGTNIGNRIDIQGVACHEIGHSLGLDHSALSSATMFASISGSGVVARSISPDDQAGVQAIYGVASAGKPLVTSLSITGNSITVNGANFSSTGNQIWFTQAGIGGSGAPIKVTNLTSNGTMLTANIPASAGPGDVLVRNNSTANSGLSNAFPSDLQPTGPSCAAPIPYCVTSPNSAGSGALMGWSGSPSVSDNDFGLACFGLPPNQFGIFFYGSAQQLNLFGDGLICVAGGGSGIVRFPAIQADFVGDVTLPLDFNAAPINTGSGQWASGTQWFVQFWYRDPAAGGTGFNLSDALDITICP